MLTLTKKVALYVTAMLFGLATPTAYAGYITVVNSPFSASGGDFLYRGFYVENYGADNLAQVVLQYMSKSTGVYDTSLTVRIGSYDGIIVGETKYLSTYLEAYVPQQVVYDFSGVSVPYGSLLTFTQVDIQSPQLYDDLFYNTGISSHPQITQTNYSNPPLDSFRRDRVGVIITAVPEPATLSLLALGVFLAGRRRK